MLNPDSHWTEKLVKSWIRIRIQVMRICNPGSDWDSVIFFPRLGRYRTGRYSINETFAIPKKPWRPEIALELFFAFLGTYPAWRCCQEPRYVIYDGEISGEQNLIKYTYLPLKTKLRSHLTQNNYSSNKKSVHFYGFQIFFRQFFCAHNNVYLFSTFLYLRFYW